MNRIAHAPRTKHTFIHANYYLKGRCDARKVGRLIDGDFHEVWMPTVRGRLVRLNLDYCLTRADALIEARAFKNRCKEIVEGVKAP